MGVVGDPCSIWYIAMALKAAEKVSIRAMDIQEDYLPPRIGRE